MSIEVKNVTKIYGKQKALNDVSFSISTGEVIGFLGPNGAGKSTMMKIITCFLPQTSGTVLVNGFDVVEESMQVRKCVGYLPEHNPLYLEMYVKEYLEFVAGLSGVKKNKKQRIAEMINLTGLEIEQKKRIGALSKGYRQRVGIAQALIHDPDVLILDEPTSGLDPNQLVEIRELIKNIGQEKTVMLSTHIMQEVEAICDRVIIINQGKLVADDQTGNIQKGKSSKVAVRVEFDKETGKNHLKSIPGVIDAQLLEGNTWILTSDEKVDVRAKVFEFSVENGLAVITLQKEEKSLEEVFQELTKK